MKPVVELSDVWVELGGHTVLEGITMTVGEGEFVSVVGPNGAGKTTLLKVILGLIRPGQGEVRVFGKAPWALGRDRARIGYVPQTEEVDLSFPIRVIDVVLMGRYGALGWMRRPAAADRRAALEAMELVGIGDLADKVIGEISGGQRQRAFLARALAARPDLILLDEPTTGVDPAASGSFYDLLHRIQGRGVTILMVTHDIGVVSQFVDKVACINRKLVVHGRPEEVVTDEVLAEMYGCAALFFHHGRAPHMVVRPHRAFRREGER
jgi:zinc transport system ATP-binding protein